MKPDQIQDAMMPNPADDVPDVRRWLPEEGLRIGVLDRTFKSHDSGPFDTEADALTYLQTHLCDFAEKRLRIGLRLYHVQPDGLYVMSNRHGWQKFEGVQS